MADCTVLHLLQLVDADKAPGCCHAQDAEERNQVPPYIPNVDTDPQPAAPASELVGRGFNRTAQRGCQHRFQNIGSAGNGNEFKASITLGSADRERLSSRARLPPRAGWVSMLLL